MGKVDRDTGKASHLSLEELKAAGHKATIFALGALCLLGLFVLLNVILLLYYRRILR